MVCLLTSFLLVGWSSQLWTNHTFSKSASKEYGLLVRSSAMSG